MADDNKSGVDKGAEATKAATNRAAEQGQDVARKGAETMQRSTDAATGAAREMTGQTVDAAGEMRNQVVELWREQARLNVEAMQQLTTAIDWQRVAQVQTEYLRASSERMAQLGQRWMEMSQSVMSTAASQARHQSQRAA